MNKKIFNVILFCSGALLGGFGAYTYTKKKYENYYKNIADDEIRTVRDFYNEKAKELAIKNNTLKENFEFKSEENIVDQYTSKDNERIKPYLIDPIPLKNNDVNEEDLEEDDVIKDPEEEFNEKMAESEPYLINPESFGSLSYELNTLYWFNDSILTDEEYRVIKDIEGTVGLENLDSFGEYDDYTIYVRNDRLKCDYEVLLDERNYKDIVV